MRRASRTIDVLSRQLLVDGVDLTPEISAADEASEASPWGWCYRIARRIR